MTRSEFDDIRAFLADEETSAEDLVRVARTLIDDLEHARLHEAVLRTRYLRLLTAARAGAAAELADVPDPLSFVRDELAQQGMLPETGEEAGRVLDDARTAEALLAHLQDGGGPRHPRGSRSRRCPGSHRSLRR
ncbi:hypothetical protein [Nonomuraea sp. NPDC050783]|uniref:hypothetical protein n=1 Tax=Nonomuraea sp. NPDC050783 TaxID=3154634 RepID=UPI0034679F5C